MTSYYYNEYMCVPIVTKDILYDLAEYYHKKCDEYDAVICSYKNADGNPFPVSAYEREKITSHAIRIRNGVIEIGRRNGYGVDEILRAIREHPLNK